MQFLEGTNFSQEEYKPKPAKINVLELADSKIDDEKSSSHEEV